MESATVAKPKGGWSSFFSKISTGLSEGLGTISKEILPVWTANQLGLQSENQLKDPTVNQIWLPESLQDQWFSIQNTMGAANDYATLKKPLFTIGSFKVNALMVSGAVLVVLIGYLFTR